MRFLKDKRLLSPVITMVILTSAIGFTYMPSRTPKARASQHVKLNPTSEKIEDPFAPESLRLISPEEARKLNALAGDFKTNVDPALPFSPQFAADGSFSRALSCMTSAIYYEAGNEPSAGQRAVAQVILNRVRHSAYPNTVCDVIFQGSERKTGCQFTFTCDGSLDRRPTSVGWNQAEQVALAALGGYVFSPIGWATHYHADYVLPYWADSLERVGVYGAHIFYRSPTATRNLFSATRSNVEPYISSISLEVAATQPKLSIAGEIPTPTQRSIIPEDRAIIAEPTTTAQNPTQRWVIPAP